MRGKFAAYSLFFRAAWLVMAICGVVFCGPVKKLIELRCDKAGAATAPSQDNRLRTCYREKKDIAVPVRSVSHCSPGTGLTLFAASSFVFSGSGLTNAVYFKAHCPGGAVIEGVPLYLRLRKIQV